MGSSGFRLRHSVIIAASAVVLAVVRPVSMEGSVSSGAPHMSPSQLDSAVGESEPAAPPIPVCGEKLQGNKNGEEANLELDAATGLQFKCAAGHTLSPPSKDSDSNVFPDVYTYDVAQNSCSETIKPLATVVNGATLKKTTEGQPTKSEDPVYTLTYGEEPEDAESLCYTCSASVAGAQNFRGGERNTQCTIRIKFAGKNTPGPPGNPDGEGAPNAEATTPAPPTSGARAVMASVATAAGGFLVVVLFS